MNHATNTRVFQSTLSMRRATVHGQDDTIAVRFQSTLSMRRATLVTARLDLDLPISIHALHEESDAFLAATSSSPRYFNPRSP